MYSEAQHGVDCVWQAQWRTVQSRRAAAPPRAPRPISAAFWERWPHSAAASAATLPTAPRASTALLVTPSLCLLPHPTSPFLATEPTCLKQEHQLFKPAGLASGMFHLTCLCSLEGNASPSSLLKTCTSCKTRVAWCESAGASNTPASGAGATAGSQARAPPPSIAAVMASAAQDFAQRISGGRKLRSAGGLAEALREAGHDGRALWQ